MRSFVYVHAGADLYVILPRWMSLTEDDCVAQVATQEGGELCLFLEFKLKLRPNCCCLSV